MACSCGVGVASVAEIDALGLGPAADLAMTRAIAALGVAPDWAIVDGRRLPRGLVPPGEWLVKGDARCLSVAAASILAKVARDAQMQHLEQRYPGYGLAQHKGYPTPAHRKALQDLGASPIHRMSFAPCREAVAGNWQPETGN